MKSKPTSIIQNAANIFQGRKAPYSPDAEVAVLGAMMLSRDAVNKATSIFTADAANIDSNFGNRTNDDPAQVFYEPRHQMIYRAILELDKNGVVPDIISLSNHLTKMGTLADVGGTYYLSEINIVTPTAAHIESHARIVQEQYFKRCLINLAENILEKNYDETSNVLEEIDLTEAKIFAIAEKRIRKNYKTMAVLAKETKKIFENATKEQQGVPTGFSNLDSILNGGLQKSNLLILAARPAMGKTAFALNIVLNAAMKYRQAVAFFSLEMASIELVKRMLSTITGINLNQIIDTRNRSQEEIDNLGKGLEHLSSVPIYFDDSPALSIMEMRSKCRRLKSERDIQLVVVDYLQLIRSIKAESREREISIISATLKQIARELDIPVLALAQLNRGLESRTDKEPMLSDLRESGSIEQDADVVMFIHRPEKYLDKDKDKDKDLIIKNNWENLAEVIISKHRNGGTGKVKFTFLGDNVRFALREERYNNDFGNNQRPAYQQPTSQPQPTSNDVDF